MGIEAKDFFQAAVNAENKKDYSLAKINYDYAKIIFLSLSDQTKKYAFRCIGNKYKNEITIERNPEIINPKETKDVSFKPIIQAMKNEVLEEERKIIPDIAIAKLNKLSNWLLTCYKLMMKRESKDINNFPKTYKYDLPTQYSIIVYVMMIINEFEKFLLEKRLEDESLELYKFYMKHKIEKYRYYRNLVGVSRKDKFFSFCTEWGFRIYGRLSDFGVGIDKILYSTSIITVLYAFIFCIFNAIKANNPNLYKIANFWECLYFSFQNLTNVGSELYVANGTWGMILECTESFLGFVLLGMVIAFITKRIQ